MGLFVSLLEPGQQFFWRFQLPINWRQPGQSLCSGSRSPPGVPDWGSISRRNSSGLCHLPRRHETFSSSAGGNLLFCESETAHSGLLPLCICQASENGRQIVSSASCWIRGCSPTAGRVLSILPTLEDPRCGSLDVLPLGRY